RLVPRPTAPRPPGRRRGVLGSRGPRTVAAAPIAEPSRNPACQRRSPRQPVPNRGRRLARRLSLRVSVMDRYPSLELDAGDVGEAFAEHPLRDRPERLDLARGELLM